MRIEVNEFPADGTTIRYYDTDLGGQASLTVIWHHGTPNVGRPPEPLLSRSRELGVRWIGLDRPGYGGSTRQPGRSVADVARDVHRLTRHLQLERFAVLGHSGGGPHALACAALLPDQVIATVTLAGLAPYGADGLPYFDGMYPGGRRELQAAVTGEDTLSRVLEDSAFDPEMFTAGDHAALRGGWAWLNSVVGPALERGPGGMIDDDLAYVRPWGFSPTAIRGPTRLYHGGADRIVPARHARWLAHAIPHADLIIQPDDGHISILDHAEEALDWLSQQAGN